MTQSDKNEDAFLDMLAASEGTTLIIDSDDGYNVLCGGQLFHSYADHPRILVDLHNGLKSTAAGRYQILERTYDAYKALLKLPDFSPDSQDAIAMQLITEAGAMPDVDEGDLYNAVLKCAHLWASLPGAQYGQRENQFTDLQAAFVAAGGVLSTDHT